MKEKHLPYFKVLDSFNAKECPICFLMRSGIEKYFDSLLYENINNASFRKKFRDNHGFCNYHSYQFLGYNDGLAISLTHRELLIDMIERLEAKSIKYPSRKKSDMCIVCELSKETEVRHISVMIEYLDDKEFKSKLLASEGLCIPHYEMLSAQIKVLPKWFADFHIKRYKEVLGKLDKYLDNCNFSLGDKRPLLAYDEQLIWKKTVKILFGFEGK